MKLLQSVQKYFETIGIYSPLSNPYDSIWNWRFVAFCIFMAQMVLSSVGFLLIHANSAAEYGFSFCAALNGIVAIIFAAIFLWKYGSKIKLLQRFEAFIDRSEYGKSKHSMPKCLIPTFTLHLPKNLIGMQESQNLKCMYRDLNDKIERRTQLIYVILFKYAMPVFILPPLIISLTKYYTSELGVESFELPLLTM